MAFKAGAELRGFTVLQIKKMIDDGAIEPAVKLTAKAMAQLARSNFRRLTKRTGKGNLLRDIKAQKSKYKDGGWIYGVLGNYRPSPGSKIWLASTGGRAHFFEYGRSAKGKGKKHGGPQPVSSRQQPPRPFMRPTIVRGQKQLEGVSSKEVGKIVNKINRGKVGGSLLKRIKAQ